MEERRILTPFLPQLQELDLSCNSFGDHTVLLLVCLKGSHIIVGKFARIGHSALRLPIQGLALQYVDWLGGERDESISACSEHDHVEQGTGFLASSLPHYSVLRELRLNDNQVQRSAEQVIGEFAEYIAGSRLDVKESTSSLPRCHRLKS